MDLGFILGAFFVFAWGDRAKTFAFEAVPALGLCFGDAKDSFQGVFRRIWVSATWFGCIFQVQNRSTGAHSKKFVRVIWEYESKPA